MRRSSTSSGCDRFFPLAAAMGLFGLLGWFGCRDEAATTSSPAAGTARSTDIDVSPPSTEPLTPEFASDPAGATTPEPDKSASPTPAAVPATTTANASPKSPATETPTNDPSSGGGLPAGLPEELREPVVALQSLGAELEYGVGDRIISVDLDGQPATDADMAHVAALPDVRSLNLAGTGITDAGLERLGTLRKLKFLYLFDTAVTDAGVRHLQQLPRLEVLCLDQTRITDEGIKLLEVLPRLEKLHVHSRLPITDAGLESLKKHTRLFELRVGGPGVTEAGIAALQETLPNCTIDYDPAQEVAE